MGRFARRRLWRVAERLERREAQGAAEAGREAARQQSLWYDEGTGEWGGPALSRFFHRQEINAVAVARDIEEDCAALYQALNPVYAQYRAGLARLRDVDRRIEEPAARLEEAKAAGAGAPLGRRALNQARMDLGPLLGERARVVAELDSLRLRAEELGLGDLRGIQGMRLADLEHHRARADELLSFFLGGAADELGLGRAEGYAQAREWGQRIVDGYVGQLEGRGAADGRWIMDFSEHDGIPCPAAE